MVVKRWNRLSREVVEPLLLEVFKDPEMPCLGTWFSDGFGSTELGAVLDGLKGLFQLLIQCFYIDCRQQLFLAQLNITCYYFQVL